MIDFFYPEDGSNGNPGNNKTKLGVEANPSLTNHLPPPAQAMHSYQVLINRQLIVRHSNPSFYFDFSLINLARSSNDIQYFYHPPHF